MSSRIKAALLGVAIIALTAGCASKPKSQEVLVAPISISGYTGPAYHGGKLVNNSDEIKAVAANLQGVVYFDFDSDAIRASAAQTLNAQADFLKANSGARVLIAGHTDERGSREYNISLGERRAAAVRAYLAAQGVNPSYIEIISFGEERPVAVGTGEANWSQNRRAELSY